MSDTDIRAARERIDSVEKRIAALNDAGVDVAALRAQLSFAHGALREGRLTDIEAICDEVMSAARRLTDSGRHPAQTRTPAHGTDLQRVKPPRPQLAEEVKSAIGAEVKAQMTTAPDPQVAQRLDEIAHKVGDLTRDVSGIRHQAERIQSLEVRLASSETRSFAASPDPAIAAQLAAITDQLKELERRPPPPPATEEIGRIISAALDKHSSTEVRNLSERIADVLLRMDDVERKAVTSGAATGPDPALITGIVAKAVEEAVPRQASELLREAISKLPTRDDLHQIAETLRADLDWRLERAAAEHGWCSLADVQSTVRKALAEQDPAGSGQSPSQLARLETVLSDFVQNSREQQERLINALAERVVQHTKSLTRSMLVRGADQVSLPSAGENDDLRPSSEHGHGSSKITATGGAYQPTQLPGKPPTEGFLDPVPQEAMDRTRNEHGNTTQVTMQVKTDREEKDEKKKEEKDESSIQELVSAAVERALGNTQGAVVSTIASGEPITAQPMPADGSSGSRRLLPSDLTPVPSMEAVRLAAPSAMPPGLDALIAAEVSRQLAHTLPVQLPPSDSDLARAVVRVLPVALHDESVRTELFSTLALEATTKPGVLAELTGLRRFLKKELEAMADSQRDTIPARAL